MSSVKTLITGTGVKSAGSHGTAALQNDYSWKVCIAITIRCIVTGQHHFASGIRSNITANFQGRCHIAKTYTSGSSIINKKNQGPANSV
jgi:hypothetical protein